MSDLENLAKKKLFPLIWIETTWLILAGFALLDLKFNPTRPEPVLYWIGSMVGLMSGRILISLCRNRIVSYPVLFIFPLWIGLIPFSVLFSGLAYYFKLQVPMDWRPVIIGGLIGTYPGVIISGIVDYWMSCDLVSQLPKGDISQTYQALIAQKQIVECWYPKSEITIDFTDNFYIINIVIYKEKISLLLNICCDENYPQTPPCKIKIYHVHIYKNERRLEEEPQVLATHLQEEYWQGNNLGLQHIVKDNLDKLRY